mmetsp:Transcript_111230/g.321600  ORF Transcript_111230/g.321600 Transcript_111230/m.321600 type:complete len:201 (+) Transcript_111230:1205-1807(+)
MASGSAAARLTGDPEASALSRRPAPRAAASASSTRSWTAPSAGELVGAPRTSASVVPEAPSARRGAPGTPQTPPWSGCALPSTPTRRSATGAGSTSAARCRPRRRTARTRGGSSRPPRAARGPGRRGSPTRAHSRRSCASTTTSSPACVRRARRCRQLGTSCSIRFARCSSMARRSRPTTSTPCWRRSGTTKWTASSPAS